MSVQLDDQAPRLVDQGPLPLFDFHLRLLADSYLDFFQERKKIEETYYESLVKLHHRSRQVDAYYDQRLAPTTTTLRLAWSEIRENIEREAHTRRAFLNTVDSEVISPLIALRETQDRIRKRIKEDIKNSVVTHTDFEENELPKLKRAYIKKCQDVEDHRAAAVAAAAQAEAPRVDNGLAPTTSKLNTGPPSRPIVTSPQPLRPLDRRPSTGTSSTRARSPPTTTTFSDFAHQGKKQLNQLMTFLDKGGAKESLGGRPESNALRSVRAKREADEADVMYRKGVHWLETLRLRREKIIEAGYHSLETLVREYTETIKKVMERYTDNLIATFSTSCQLGSHGREQVNTISTQKDVKNVLASISHSRPSTISKPVLYYNFYVGECKDLIFGFSLLDYATARNLPDGQIPRIVRLCIEEIDKRGLDVEGIYRVSGRLASVVELTHKIERNEQGFSFNPLTDDLYVISTLLKMYLRDLPEPLFKVPLQERIQHSQDIKEHIATDFQLLRSKIRRLPTIHRNTLKAVMLHLNRVAAHREKNKMDVKNLAIVFGIFGSEDELPKGGDLLSVQATNDTLLADLITHAPTLFNDHHPSPPLPPAPSDEPVPPVSYGSQHTKVAELAPDDFTPRLPGRPPQSIHPASRVNGGSFSPTKSHFDPPSPPPPPLKPGRQAAASQIPSMEGLDLGLDFESSVYQEKDSIAPSDQSATSGFVSRTPRSGPTTPLSPPLPLSKPLPPTIDSIEPNNEHNERLEAEYWATSDLTPVHPADRH